MTETTLDLWRQPRKEDFPAGTMMDGAPVSGVLYPAFEDKYFKSGGEMRKRDADVAVTTEKGENFVSSGGGTSLFNKDGVFPARFNWSFQIPKGTVIPESLKIVYTHYNKKFDADHYQIECVAGKMEILAFKGALDNLARNAVTKLCELAK